jgi:RND family efflux transporter MFP subunit
MILNKNKNRVLAIDLKILKIKALTAKKLKQEDFKRINKSLFYNMTPCPLNLFGFIIFLISLPVHAENMWTTVQPSYRQVIVTGFSRARHSMVLSTEVEGKVERVFADVGDIIPKHGKVACLDDTFVKIDINLEKSEIAQYQNDIHYFKKQVERYQNLVGKNSAAVSKLDDWQRQLANAQHQKQQKKLDKLRQQEKRKRHCIKSPAGWHVIDRYVEPGQWLLIGNQVAKVGNYTKLLVPLALSVNELKALENNQHQLVVGLPEYGQQVPATIERISPAFDEKSRKVQVDLLLEKNLPVNRGGLRVELRLNLPDPSGTFSILAGALDKRFEEVWLERKNGGALRVELLGYADNGQVRIASPEINIGDQFKILKP